MPPSSAAAISTARALEQAREMVARSGGRLTPQRAQVFEIVHRAAAPVSAYEVMRLLTEQSGRQVNPPTVYRALEFLLEQGLVARLESRNAYLACSHPQEQHDHMFFVCPACGRTVEFANEKISAMLSAAAEAAGFAPVRQVVEIEGACAACRDAGNGA